MSLGETETLSLRFAFTVLAVSTNIAFNLILVKFGLLVPLSEGLIAQEMTATSKAVVMDILSVWSENFIILIADIAIVWRAWVLWQENRLIKWMLLIILLADIGGLFCHISLTYIDIGDYLGAVIADAVLDTKADISLNDNTVTMDWLSIALNLTVNIVATLLIAHRAWTHHQSVCVILRNKKTQVEAILLLMVESGAIFGVLQVANIVFNALEIHAANFSPVDNAYSFLEELYMYSAALNPVALVILIQTGNTYEQSFHLEDGPSLEINSVLIIT
ncbi:hypothetical protein BT96DRAFT_1061106 [Gymnopus androsaceus JB14]|uniref:Uncharacterized protein n=1 Tax=Gymnopus androsaceus JB14 TaxID=1447944 RepID=A0A6A4H289_9AGAR|nr:hypothetical protein BT96DRAFT_1061106 [Gymnopus androsaceus JB14]